MSNLIRAELFKLRRNKSFWVIISIVTGLSALLHYLVMIDWWMMDNTNFVKAGIGEFNALSAFTTLVFFNLIVSPLAGFFISTEFSLNGVIKNQIIGGNKRSHIFLAKYIVFSIGAVISTVVIPFIVGLLLLLVLGYGEVLTSSVSLYLCRALLLFTLQFLGYTALMTVFAMLSEDSGKTIIFSILFTIIMFAIEKFTMPQPLAIIYNYSIFQQFSHVFQPEMTSSDMITSVLVGVITLILGIVWGMFMLNRKEIK